MANKFNIPDSITLKCLFCGGTQFEIEKDKEHQGDDLLTCGSCGEKNLYSGMMAVEVEALEKTVAKEIEKMAKSILKF